MLGLGIKGIGHAEAELEGFWAFILFYPLSYLESRPGKPWNGLKAGGQGGKLVLPAASTRGWG
jgi:hypothetical protein